MKLPLYSQLQLCIHGQWATGHCIASELMICSPPLYTPDVSSTKMSLSPVLPHHHLASLQPGRLKGDWRCIRTIPWWHLLEDQQYSSDSYSTPISISLWKGHSGNMSPGWRDASMYKGPPQSPEPQQKACKELAHCIPVWVSAQMGRGLVWSVVVHSNY